VQQAVDGLADGEVSPERVAAVKSHVKYAFLTDLETPSQVADVAAQFLAVGGDLSAMGDYLTALSAVTPEDVARVAQQYLNDDRRFVVTLAPGTAEAQPEPSRERLRELDASIRAERAALDDFREAWEAEVAGKRTRFEERADRLRALRQERSRLETRRAELERRVRQAGAEQSTVEEALRTLRGASRGLAERLHLHLGEVPGAGSRRGHRPVRAWPDARSTLRASTPRSRRDPGRGSP